MEESVSQLCGYVICYIRCEMTPTSVGGEQQIRISGGSQSPILYSLRQDCRDAQKKYVMHCMTRISQQECRGILEFFLRVKTENQETKMAETGE